MEALYIGLAVMFGMLGFGVMVFLIVNGEEIIEGWRERNPNYKKPKKNNNNPNIDSWQ